MVPRENSSLYSRFLLYNDEFFIFMEEKNITKKSDAALREEAVLEFWKDNKIFEKSIEQTEGGKEYIFYDGPVTANSKPVLHTMVPFSFKDIIPRYKTMQGFHVRRKGGWDTHGLPVELQIEKKLGFKSKNDIENYGIAAFNKLCKESVWEYIGLWKNFTNRMGYWADQENAYVTYHNDYIESVWNVIKKVNEQKLLYKDYKVVPWCPRCGTVLSSHELAQGYEDVKDLSLYVKFKVCGGGNDASAGSLSPDASGALPLGSSACETPRKSDTSASTYILAWTTTPWTLTGNVALAVGEKIDYVKISAQGGSASGGKKEFLILAKARLSIITEPYEVIEEMKGKDLIGLEYEPLFPYLSETISKSEKPKLEKAFKVYGADFVTTEDGTGVVHTAVMYGQDDFVLGTQVGLPKHHLVNLEGKFIKGTGFLEGRFVKEKDENGKPTLDIDIIKYLTDKNLFFNKENYQHSYPHCWRCHTALIYYARDSWYIRMSDSKIKGQLISENKSINWEPSYIKEGRFGEWLREIKDWAISRERYWGTPMPVYICESCKEVDVIGSVADLKNKTKKSGNKYFVMRHGESEGNEKNLVSSKVGNIDHLTKKGEKQIFDSIPELKNKKIDLIISSDFMRTKETAEIVKKELKLSNNSLIFDERLWELNTGVFDGKTWKEYFDFRGEKGWFNLKAEGGESCKEMKLRTASFLYDLEKKYKNKIILIVTHEAPARILIATAKGLNDVESEKQLKKGITTFRNAQIVDLYFTPIPHNEDYELDLHKPYIDEVPLVCKCGGKLTRTKEVMDVWLDSGTMPFSQDHYPFENRKWIEGKGYPADFICEAIDQTRGWFYTLHAVGVLMGRGKAYKNVICLGHLLDAKGKKMSKSLGNIVDPWIMIEKYGVDTLRLWMYCVNQPGESKNFDEKTVVLLHQQVFGLLFNVLTFYELYRDKELEKISQIKSKNILDQWILARLNELIKLSTENIENYKLLEPTRAIRDFIGDLSTWYLRRSRERIKEGDKEAKQTLYFVLKTFTKIMAPFAPFTAEDIWLKLKNDPAKDGASNNAESVHLEKWPKTQKSIFEIFTKKEVKILENMEVVRKVVTLGLEARQKAGIKVRQPLASLKLKVESRKLSSEYLDLIKDELNVKEIITDNSIANEVELDVKITEELKAECDCRELSRAVQDMRKKLGLTPSDIISLVLKTDDAGKKLVQKFENDMKKTVLASGIEFKDNDGEEVKIDNLVFRVKIDKIRG